MSQPYPDQARAATAGPTEPTSAAPKIDIRNLSKIFQLRHSQVPALLDINLTVPDGQFFCMVGPSGCGKTTLLRILAGLEKQTGGDLSIRRSDASKPINSMVFQEQSVLPWMTVWDNVAYGLRMRGIDRRTRDEIVEHYVRMVGLTRFARAYPHQLSGGMKQRVSVARAFANDPEVLLMDEPFAALDEQNKILLQEELLKIWEQSKKTVVFITHSIDEAAFLSDRILVMTAHPGRVKAIIDVPFPRPREVYKLKARPEFGELTYRIWEQLRDEVIKAKQEEMRE